MPNLMTVAATATTVDMGIVGELIELCKTCMGLFSEFPMNVLLIGSLVGIGFGIFRNAKRSVK
uniref:hypothetical protein n=1 Tax=Acetatifactor sp. TaxID=1872090 RepID=UPI004056F352